MTDETNVVTNIVTNIVTNVTTLCIGDPHVQVTNIPEVNIFIERLVSLAEEKQPDLIIVLGDTLHTHERLHTTALNKAYEMIDKLRMISKTYVLVGNHDMCNNQQFLTDNHWLCGMKEWDNTVIVDKVVSETIKGKKFVFLPYVPPGRFEEALNTMLDWKDASCIFAHQEFSGCKMGAITSVEGDNWSLDFPPVVSGHIHCRQIPQRNIYYPGSAMQHAFGESEKNIIAHLTFSSESTDYIREEVDLKLPRKKIIYMDVEDVDDFEDKNTDDKIKITLSGNYDQFKALKKTKKYKNLLDKGVKVVFKPKKIVKKNENNQVNQDNKGEQGHNEALDKSLTADFKSILENMVMSHKDPFLYKTYELVVNGKEADVEDILFL